MEVNIDGKAAVVALDVFSKTYCLNAQKTEAAGRPIFRCEEECPFKCDEGCAVRIFWVKYAPEYKDFGPTYRPNKKKRSCGQNAI